MSRATPSLRETLARAGIAVAGKEALPSLEAPWYVRALQALSGWLAALFLLVFIGLAAIPLIESSLASMVMGLTMLATAYGLLRKTPGDFGEHLALAISLAGQGLAVWAVGTFLGAMSVGLWWAVLALQAVLATAMPSSTHRILSAFAASLALYMVMAQSGIPYIASGLILLALTWLWLNEFRWPARMRHMQSLGYGLLLGVLTLQLVAYFGQPLMGWWYGFDTALWSWMGPWMADVLAMLALLLLRGVFQHHERPIEPVIRIVAYGAVAVLMLVSFQAHGVLQGGVVVALGFAIGNRVVAGLGVILLLSSIGSYYYLLDVTLLTKAMTLFAIGVSLLAMRWLLRYRWQPAEGDVDE
ncbi:DUF4401 domain-containing protein [Aidingimonas halophila]|uniref:DUF4401 domain-containing protein n=1 Tax=Aidingimonas halophila TaxID=574349 RepID=A0A1H2UZY1_9GAMM|nr:DUF4401 domain-containing protein [Aidingimonas halophila]GHC23415.1 hypothetical protein GCM10008094_12740 [Aidingimonas halophila]SDW61219.1 protein of unknown function [Aidingimonas halophila]